MCYKDRQRRILPPIYDERRINEQPIPNINPPDLASIDNDHEREYDGEFEQGHVLHTDNSASDGDISDSFINSAEHNIEEREIELDVLDIPVDPNDDPLATIGPNPIVKREVINGEENEDVDTLVSCHFDVYDDDVLMCYDNENAFKPMISQWEIKRNDIFSGNIPFIEYDNGEEKKDRGYMVKIDGEAKEIRFKATYLKKFDEWNSSANDSLLDGRYISTLMAVCIGKRNLRERNFSPNTIDFIRGRYFLHSSVHMVQ